MLYNRFVVKFILLKIYYFFKKNIINPLQRQYLYWKIFSGIQNHDAAIIRIADETRKRGEGEPGEPRAAPRRPRAPLLRDAHTQTHYTTED